MTPDDIAQTLRVCCASLTTLGLATVHADGRPHAANVNFVTDDALNLHFVSHPASAHSQHIAANPAVAGAAYAPFRGPAEIRGIQVHGACAPIREGEFDGVWSLFLRKFPYAQAMEERVREEQFYRIAPTWFRYIDNSVRFGFKWETPWPIQ